MLDKIEQALSPIDSKQKRKKILAFEEAMSNMAGARFGDDAAPLNHTFTDGLYLREITMPRGMIVTSKIHKTNHPYFILKGDVSIATDEETVRIKAPYYGITKAGTKRVLYIHETTVWVTVHKTDKTDLQEIEDDIIAKSYNELPTHKTKELK